MCFATLKDTVPQEILSNLQATIERLDKRNPGVDLARVPSQEQIQKKRDDPDETRKRRLEKEKDYQDTYKMRDEKQRRMQLPPSQG